jgi:hypothetical protein
LFLPLLFRETRNEKLETEFYPSTLPEAARNAPQYLAGAPSEPALSEAEGTKSQVGQLGAFPDY